MKFKMIHENYNVSDLDRSIQFYNEALDLHEVRRKTTNDFIIVSGNVVGDVPGTDSLSGILILEDVLRACLKNHSCNLHDLIYRRFCRKHFSNII